MNCRMKKEKNIYLTLKINTLIELINRAYNKFIAWAIYFCAFFLKDTILFLEAVEEGKTFHLCAGKVTSTTCTKK